MTMAAVVAVLASTHVGAVTDTVRHGVMTGRPVDGSMRWWTGWPPRVQRRRPTPEVARPPPRTATVWTGEGASHRSAIPTAKPPGGGGPATARSPPRETRVPHPNRSAMAADDPVGRPGLGRRPQIDPHTAGQGDGRPAAVEMDGPPPGSRDGEGQRIPLVGFHGVEVDVIAQAEERVAHGGVDRPSGGARRRPGPGTGPRRGRG